MGNEIWDLNIANNHFKNNEVLYHLTLLPAPAKSMKS